MERSLATLALVALASGFAAAQPPVSEWITVEVEPFEELVRPLQGPVSTSFTARVSCLLTTNTGDVYMTYTVVEQPEWATVLVSPATDVRKVTDCENGATTFEGTLVATANDRAPGFTPAAIAIEARATAAQAGEQAARGIVNLSASYFSIIDVQLAEATIVMVPGQSRDLAVRLTNFGNALTRVEPVLEEVTPGILVTPPAPLILESRQQGGTAFSAEMALRVEAPEADGVVNRVHVITMRLLSAYATDDSFKGDESTVSFLVTVRSGGAGGSALQALPLGWALVPAALLAAAALRMSSPRRPPNDQGRRPRT